MQFIKGMTVVAASALVAAMTYGCSASTTPLTTTDPDAGTKDSGSTTKDSGSTTKDSGGGGTDSGGGGSCAPGDVSSYAPTYVPAAVVKGACTTQQIKDFDTNCITGTNTTACTNWIKANGTCVKCLVTPDTSAKYGALVEGNGVDRLNIAGCFELQGDQTCAKAIQASGGCGDAACGANCPVTDQASFAAYQGCVKTASSGVCKKYVDPANACENADSGTAAKCADFADFESGYLALAPIFCGP